MSKITDLSVVKAAVIEVLEEQDPLVMEYFSLQDTANMVTMIYATNDLITGFGQDFSGNMSVISSPTRIAVIFGGHHSFYKMDSNICLYEDLAEDIDAILLCLNTAIARWEAVCDQPETKTKDW